MSRAGWVIAFGVVACGCRGGAQSEAPPPQPQVEQKPRGPLSVDELVRTVSERAKGRTLGRLDLRYVRPDGMMDPTYGEMAAEIIDLPEKPEEPPDDPKRPVGAPVPRRHATVNLFSDNCTNLSWRHGGLVQEDRGTCMSLQSSVHTALRCNAAQLWARAKRDGAPEGLAVISLRQEYDTLGGAIGVKLVWRFAITDEPRGIEFSREYPDDCSPIVEKAEPQR